eukprot:9376534-Heterocapsa_arctica.AAC.1
MESYCDHTLSNKKPELHQFLDQSTLALQANFNIGLNLGNQYHRTGKLRWSPKTNLPCLTGWMDKNRECRHRRNIES